MFANAPRSGRRPGLHCDTAIVCLGEAAKRLVACVIHAYLDGSASDGIVGLAAYVASEADWEDFERDWRERLNSQRMDFVHVKDLSQRQESFSGKDSMQAHHAAGVFVSYLAGLPERSFRRYSCAIRKSDYERASEDVPRLSAKPLHAICVDHCTGRLFRPHFWDERDRAAGDTYQNIEIYFDGGEPFFEHIRKLP